MCGKFTQFAELERLEALLEQVLQGSIPPLTVTPGRPAALLAADMTLGSMRWGFASAPGEGRQPVINARHETLQEKPMWRGAARALVPVAAFFEADSANRRFEVSRADGGIFLLGALWQRGRDGLPEFTIATCQGHAPLDERMPVILASAAAARGWLSHAALPAHLPDLRFADDTKARAAGQMSLF